MRTFAQEPKVLQQTKTAKSTEPSRPLSGQRRDVHSILQLQRTIGNHTVQRLLQVNADELQVGSATTASTRFGHDLSRIPIFSLLPVQVQPKLTASAPGDMYEQEADRVADQVMRLPERKLLRTCVCGGGCPKCQAEQVGYEHELLRTSRGQANDAAKPTAPPIVHDVLRSPGQPLDSAVRAYFEPRFNYDFSRVRVPTDVTAAHSAKALNALAYTAGSDVVFGAGRYDPSSACFRIASQCDEESQSQSSGGEETVLQTKKDAGLAQHAPRMESGISALREGGRPLPQSLRAFFEPRFGYDFSQVRVHPDAARAASGVQARAFTLGRDIHFDSGQYAPATRGGKWLLAHELTHVIQQRALPDNRFIQRKAEGAKTPTFKDCSATTTLSSNPNRELEQARDRASDYVDVAFAVLARDPERYRKDSTYRIALGRHFISPTDTDRQTIRANYQKILEQLKPDKIRCVTTQADRDYCDKDFDAAQMAAFARGGETFLCQSFWPQVITCRAITLIHEAAHNVGLGLGAGHPPYRGSTEYPNGGNPPGSGETTSLRMGNPDAYAYFAAHIWRETDTECSIFVGKPETIEIIQKAPGR